MSGVPCFDPTCDCCSAWEALDDQRLAAIDELNMQIEALANDLREEGER